MMSSSLLHDSPETAIHDDDTMNKSCTIHNPLSLENSPESQGMMRRAPMDIVFELNDERLKDPENLDDTEDEDDFDRLVLYNLCEKEDWTQVRSWLADKPMEAARRAILAQGPTQMTSLHLLCSHAPTQSSSSALSSAAAASSAAPPPPPTQSLVYRFLLTAPDACSVPDFAGRLPIHHAIIAGADKRVVDILAKACPDSLLVKDNSGLYPFLEKNRSESFDSTTAAAITDAAAGTNTTAVHGRTSVVTLKMKKTTSKETPPKTNESKGTNDNKSRKKLQKCNKSDTGMKS